jgi:hypothetical protein
MSETILYDIIQDQNTVIYNLKSSVGERTKMDDFKLKMSKLIDEYFHENNQQDLVKMLEEKDIEIKKQKDIIDELNERYDKMILNNRQNINEIDKALEIIKKLKTNETYIKEEKLNEEDEVETYHLKMTKMEREFRKQAEEKANKFKTFQ